MNRASKFLESTAGLVCAVFIVLLIFGSYGYWMYYNFFLRNPTEAGTFGDMFGGINAFFTACTVLLVFYAARLQKKELDATRAEFQQQNETTKLQRFETTFFNLITLYTQIKKDLFILVPHEEIEEHLVKIEGDAVFFNIIEYVHNKVRTADMEYSPIWHKIFIDKYEADTNREREIPHYYKHIMNVFTFIKDSGLPEEQKLFYSKTFYTLMSPKELGLIFYYVALKRDLDEELQYFIRKQAIFQPIFGIQILAHPTHWEMNYPKFNDR
jgi:hypothetical protein